MDDMMILQLMQEMEETAQKARQGKASEETLETQKPQSPYQNVQQEISGQYMSMFNDIDAVLQAVEEERLIEELLKEEANPEAER